MYIIVILNIVVFKTHFSCLLKNDFFHTLECQLIDWLHVPLRMSSCVLIRGRARRVYSGVVLSTWLLLTHLHCHAFLQFVCPLTPMYSIFLSSLASHTSLGVKTGEKYGSVDYIAKRLAIVSLISVPTHFALQPPPPHTHTPYWMHITSLVVPL